MMRDSCEILCYVLYKTENASMYGNEPCQLLSSSCSRIGKGKESRSRGRFHTNPVSVDRKRPILTEWLLTYYLIKHKRAPQITFISSSSNELVWFCFFSLFFLPILSNNKFLKRTTTKRTVGISVLETFQVNSFERQYKTKTLGKLLFASQNLEPLPIWCKPQIETQKTRPHQSSNFIKYSKETFRNKSEVHYETQKNVFFFTKPMWSVSSVSTDIIKYLSTKKHHKVSY